MPLRSDLEKRPAQAQRSAAGGRRAEASGPGKPFRCFSGNPSRSAQARTPQGGRASRPSHATRPDLHKLARRRAGGRPVRSSPAPYFPSGSELKTFYGRRLLFLLLEVPLNRDSFFEH